MQDELKELEEKYSIDWREFEVGELFYILGGKQPDNNNRFDKKDIKMVNTITGATTENGINFYSYSEKYFNNELTISKDGAYAGTVFYQSQPFILGGHVLGIFSKGKTSKNFKTYIATLINKAYPLWMGYDRPTVPISKLQKLKIALPTADNKIAFDYIEEFLATLEAERLATLEAYLKVTGLDDITLTHDEQEALDRLDSVEWGEFRIEEVLEWQKNIAELNPLKLAEISISDEKKYPFYGQSTTNKGIIKFLHLEGKVLNNKLSKPTILIHSNNQNIIYLDTPFYLKDGHGATSVLQSEYLNRFIAFFFMGSINRVILNKFSYNSKATKINLKNTLIELPTKYNGSLDYAYMTSLIKATQKVVIKDVVNWLDKRIDTTKTVIEK